MASLGKNVVSAYTGIANDDIRNVSISEECETIDVTARGSGNYKNYAAGFTSTTVEIECLSHSLAVGDLIGELEVVGINVNEPLDDVVSYTITLKNGDPA